MITFGCQQNNPTPSSNITSIDEYYVITISNNTVEGYFNFAGFCAMDINPTNSNGIVNGTFTTPTYTRTKLLSTPLHLFHNLYFINMDPNVIGCIDIELKSYVDGSLHETVNFVLGKTSISPIVNCSINGDSYDYDSYWP